MRHALFTDCINRSMTQALSVIDLVGATTKLAELGETELVLELYRTWITHNPTAPLLFAVYFNYGVTLRSLRRWVEAGAAFEVALRLNPGFMPAHLSLGLLFEEAGNEEQAMARWTHTIGLLQAVTGDNVGYKVTALRQLARLLTARQEHGPAEQAMRQLLEISPQQRDATQALINARQKQCLWPLVEPWGSITRHALLEAAHPMSVQAYTDDPMFQLASSHHFYRHNVADWSTPFSAGGWARPERPRSDRLRIGYVSSDLRSHAVGYLTTEIFELHDRAKVEVFAYYSGVDMKDAIQARIRSTVDHWLDFTTLSDKQAAQQIIADGIDILVDLNGYTKDGRLGLFALRPAPIIVNWLGFPGSMGTPHHHYIIADGFVIPPEAEKYYSEKVVRLPCYQPNDRRRQVAAQRPSRAEHGLPETAMVYCCFNSLHKVTRPVFERWMTILARVPSSVLWLLSASETANERLRQHAAQHGIAADRLVFAPTQWTPEHLTRYPLADLFLDTTPYSAHTTTSDALWMGLPVITVPGRSFASRVCGSLVGAAGLPDMICPDEQAYVETAVRLGNDRAELLAVRNRLADNRDRCVLFDTPSLVSHLESLYAQMWSEFCSGRLPQPDLTNLEVYHELGCEDNPDQVAPSSAEAYERHYQVRLAARNSVMPLAADCRLWRATAD